MNDEDIADRISSVLEGYILTPAVREMLLDELVGAVRNIAQSDYKRWATRVLAIHRNGADYNDCAICSFGLARECGTVKAVLGSDDD